MLTGLRKGCSVLHVVCGWPTARSIGRRATADAASQSASEEGVFPFGTRVSAPAASPPSHACPPAHPRAPRAAVTIVAGRYRSGKSFLMNQLVGDAAGFSVGHTVASHTKGIWLCSAAVPSHTASGEPITQLFMDSEGLGATDKVRPAAASRCYLLLVAARASSRGSRSRPRPHRIPAPVPPHASAERPARHDHLLARRAAVLDAHLQRRVDD